MRKPRAKSKLASLPEPQHAQLLKWLLEENLSYPQIVANLAAIGVQTSRTSVSEFYQRVVAERITRQPFIIRVPAGTPNITLILETK